MSVHDLIQRSNKRVAKELPKQSYLICESGFAFVEVLIALVILALAFLVMLPGITSLAGEATQELSNHALMLA